MYTHVILCKYEGADQSTATSRNAGAGCDVLIVSFFRVKSYTVCDRSGVFLVRRDVFLVSVCASCESFARGPLVRTLE